MLHYIQNKPAKSKQLPVLFIHGLKGTHLGMADMAKEMPGWEWYVPDLPGHGASELMEQHSLEEYARTLQKFMHERKIKKYLVVGHSYGANIAITLAQLAGPAEVPKMVAIAPYPGYKNTPTNAAFTSMYLFIRYFPKPIVNFMLLSKLAVFITGSLLYTTPDKERVKVLQRQGYHEPTTFEKRVMVEAVESLRQFELRASLAKLKQPTLLLYGEKDTFAKLNGVEKEVTNKLVEVEQYPGGGHLIPLEYPPQVAAIVERWLKQ